MKYAQQNHHYQKNPLLPKGHQTNTFLLLYLHYDSNSFRTKKEELLSRLDISPKTRPFPVFVNNSMRTRGIQIGFLNQNEKRKLPLINWNFSD